MPLSVNVGLSRKASKDYQSTGVSINVTAELDQSLLARPDELRRQIADLYAQAKSALDRQASGMGSRPQRNDEESDTNRPERNTRRPQHPAGGNGRGLSRNGDHADGIGHDNGNIRGGRPMTVSQRRAIGAIAARLEIDPNRECFDTFGAELNALTIRQASELIDHLNAIQPNGNGPER
jgi:hypothetical protein